MLFPKELTNKDWQKNKGLLAKAKPTGIGEALTALEKEFGRSGFAVDPTALAADTLDPLVFGKRLATYVKTLGVHGKKIDVAAGAVQTKITAAKATFKTNRAVLTVLTSLESDLANLRAGVKPEGTAVTDVTTALQAAYKKRLKAAPVFAQTVTKGLAASTQKHRLEVLGDIKRLEGDPRLELVNEMWGTDGAARTLRTTPKLWDQVLVRELPELTAKLLAGSAMTAYNKLPWVDTVGNEPGRSTTKALTERLNGSTDPADVKRVIERFSLEYSNSLIKYTDFVTVLAKLEAALKKAAA